jgi:hypothetical protein
LSAITDDLEKGLQNMTDRYSDEHELISWEKAPERSHGNINPEAWRTDARGWTLLDTLPNLTEPEDTGHSFLADTGVEYSVRIDKEDVERCLGVSLTTLEWRAVAVRLNTTSLLAAREIFANCLAAAWARHLASDYDQNND